ncbi:MAG TPA: GntR family transcriptional regulator [Pseudonocardia sp.]|nr:GntR family transcriptional regulator [Pseudonocardia sp.]
MTNSMRRISTTTVVEQVTEEIRRSILAGVLSPNQELSLRELADRLGVSTIPVREALRRLEGQGLLVTTPGRSSRVAPLDSADLRGIYRLRLMLEPEIASRSCLLLPDIELERLGDVVESFGVPGRRIDDMYDMHNDFHLRLLAPAATEWDIRTLRGLWHAAERYLRLAFGALEDHAGEHPRREFAHTELLDGFRARDPALVESLVRQHLSDNEAIAQQAIAPMD